MTVVLGEFTAGFRYITPVRVCAGSLIPREMIAQPVEIDSRQFSDFSVLYESRKLPEYRKIAVGEPDMHIAFSDQRNQPDNIRHEYRHRFFNVNGFPCFCRCEKRIGMCRRKKRDQIHIDLFSA